MTFIEGCNKEEKATTLCSTSQETLSLRFEVPKLLWRTGRGLFGQMRPKSTELGQMESSGFGSRLARG
jgi:hypothetical protein